MIFFVDIYSDGELHLWAARVQEIHVQMYAGYLVLIVKFPRHLLKKGDGSIWYVPR